MKTVLAPAHTRWAIDATHTSVEFAVRHLMITTVKGRFGSVVGTVTLDEADPSQTEVEVTIDAASIDTRVAQRDDHLRSPDFFDVERFPTLTFKSRKAIPVDAERVKLIGDLTIRGVTRPVELEVCRPWQAERSLGRRARRV